MRLQAVPRRGLARLFLTLFGAATTLAASATDPAQQATRDAFRQAYSTAQQGGDAWRSQATRLHDYVLYPYLEAAALTHDLRQLDLARVQAYLQRYPGMLPAQALRLDFLYELARREDWSDFNVLYQNGLGDALTCDALQAKLAGGGRLDFDRDLASLWRQASLPSACDSVLDAAHDQGLLTPQRLSARIDSAVKGLRGGTVASLAIWLPQAQADEAQRLALALRNPADAVSAAAQWPDTARARQAAALALQRLAPRQSAAAEAGWQTLQPRFSFSTAQRDDVLNAIALFRATDFDPDAMQRLADLPASAQSDATREWRVRVALSRQDWRAVLDAIDALSPTQRDDEEWLYFRARALAQLGQPAQARERFEALAGEPNYFGFLAADRVHADYAICPSSPSGSSGIAQSLLAQPGMQRAFELYAVGLPKLARREWNRALNGADLATKTEAANLAYQQGWYDRSIFIFSSGKAMRYYQQRFPLAMQDGVVPQAQQAGIEPAWAYGILRAESAWTSDAHSGANARGLMQLLPSTAERVASLNDLPWGGADSLYQPMVNIQLGTRYLAQMAARFNNAPWLASAAYNAGPEKVDQWLDARGSLPPDLFTATIPYHETRDYVARVMAFSVIYDWRLSKNVVPLEDRMTPIGQTYVPPSAGTVRRKVSCPAEENPPTRMARPPENTRPVMPATPVSSTSSS